MNNPPTHTHTHMQHYNRQTERDRHRQTDSQTHILHIGCIKHALHTLQHTQAQTQTQTHIHTHKMAYMQNLVINKKRWAIRSTCKGLSHKGQHAAGQSKHGGSVAVTWLNPKP